MASVFVCTPHGRPVDPAVTQALMQMQNAALEHNYMYAEVATQIVGKAREMLVETSLPHHPDVLFFIDDDVIVPVHAHVLIDLALQYGIIGGLYVMRTPPYTPQIFRLATEEEYKERKVYWPLLEWPEDEIFEVDAIGFGCVAIRADVFHGMKEFHAPKFKIAADAVREVLGATNEVANIVERLSPWFEFLTAKGEDLYFSERAQEAGYKIYANPNVMCEHLGDVPLRLEHFYYLRDQGVIKLDVETGRLMLITEAPPGLLEEDEEPEEDES